LIWKIDRVRSLNHPSVKKDIFRKPKKEEMDMDDYYLGTVMLIAYPWAPRNFALCQGQVIPITQNQALFSLLGINFGGDGQTTFGLPDLRGRVPVGQGQGPKTIDRPFAKQFGSDAIALTTSNLPSHNHGIAQGSGQTVTATASATVNAKNAQANKLPPTGFYWARGYTGSAATQNYADTHDTTMAADAVQVSVTPTFNVSNLVIGLTGLSQPFAGNPPSLPLNYSICTAGLYPSRD
jgi:microcystin-dependent protein